MAAGSEPDHIFRLLGKLRPLSSALSLCGAGAGGYALVMLKKGNSHFELFFNSFPINLIFFIIETYEILKSRRLYQVENPNQ